MKLLKHNRSLVFMIALILIFSLTACGTQTTTENETEKADKASDSVSINETEQTTETIDPLGKYESPIEITTVKAIDPTMKYMEGESAENNIWIKGYESELGIKVKLLWSVNMDQYRQKLNVSLASGDMPDIIPCYKDQFGTIMKSGISMPLDQIYADWASPLTKSVLEEDGGIQLSSARYKGQLMAIPCTEAPFTQAFITWIRSDWIKNLGLPEPKTIDDLEKLAIAFTNDDPDKNNKNDTYGICMDKNFILDGFCSVAGFFNGCNVYPKIWVKDSSGKLGYGSIQPEAKLALEKLQNLYKQGAVNKEFAIEDAGKASEDLVSGKAGIMWGMYWAGGYPLQGCKDNIPSSEWKAYILPTNSGSSAKYQLNMPVSQYYVVNKECKNPEALFKMLGMNIRIRYDNNNPNDEYVKYIMSPDPAMTDFQPYKYALFIANRTTEDVDAYNELQVAIKNNDPSGFKIRSNVDTYNSMQKYFAGDMKNWGLYAIVGEGGSLYAITEMVKNKDYMMNEFYGAPTTTMSEKWVTLEKMEDEIYTNIIMGASLDEFDKFVDNWKKLGGDTVTKEINEWYDSK